MKPSPSFITAITAFLEQEAATDQAFAQKMQQQPSKTPEAVCNFILAEVSKSQQNGYADEEIYGMVRHFIDEPTLSDPGAKNNAVSRVIVNTNVSLTQEEKKKAYREAVDLYQKKLEANAKPKKRARTPQQPALMGDLFGGQY